MYRVSGVEAGVYRVYLGVHSVSGLDGVHSCIEFLELKREYIKYT